MERDFKGVWIPKEIWLNEKLSAIDKIIFTEINSLDSEENGCFASNEYLANFCQVSAVTVSRSISKLCNLGFLEIKSFDGRHREIKSSIIKMIRQNYQNDKAELSKCYANNIDNNIDNIFTHTEKQESKNPQADFFERWNISTDDIDGRCVAALSGMDFEKLSKAVEESKNYLQVAQPARFSTFYIKNYKRIIAGFYKDDNHKKSDVSNNTRHKYDMDAIKNKNETDLF